MRARTVFTYAIALLLGLFGSASSVLGCLCSGTLSVEDELREATAVFSGKFIAAEYRKGIVSELAQLDEKIAGEDYEVLVLKFQVERWWKGNPIEEVELITEEIRLPNGHTMVTDCEYPFETGKRYLVYAYGDENGLSTNRCTRTKRLKEAQEDLKKLGEGRKPERSGQRQP